MTRRLAAFAIAVTAALVMLTAGAIENGKADSRPACTHGLSSLGPIYLGTARWSRLTTPVTEACLP